MSSFILQNSSTNRVLLVTPVVEVSKIAHRNAASPGKLPPYTWKFPKFVVSGLHICTSKVLAQDMAMAEVLLLGGVDPILLE